MNEPETLNDMEQLKKSGFARPYPRHGLKLLYWFAKDCLYFDDDNNMCWNYDPEEGHFGFKLFENRDKLLPEVNLKYYEVGNLSEAYQLPDYVREDYTQKDDDCDRNTDHIIVSVDYECFNRVYVTEHSDQTRFNRDATYRISRGLITIIKRLTLEDFLMKTGYTTQEEDTYWWIEDSLSEDTDQGTEDSLNEDTDWWIEDSLSEDTEQGTEESLSEDTDQGTEDSLSEDTDWWIEDSLSEDTDQGTEDSLSEDTDQGTEDSLSEDTDQGTEDSLSEDTDQGTEDSLSKDTDQGTEESLNENTDQGTEDSLNEDTDQGTEDSLNENTDQGTEDLTLNKDTDQGTEDLTLNKDTDQTSSIPVLNA